MKKKIVNNIFFFTSKVTVTILESSMKNKSLITTATNTFKIKVVHFISFLE